VRRHFCEVWRIVGRVGLIMSGLSLGHAMAVSTSFWALHGEKDLREGKLDGVALSQKGLLTLAPRFKRIAPSLSEEIIWCVAEVSSKEVWFGTGHQGKIYRWNVKGDLSEFVTLSDLEVLCLEPDGKGGAWAGTGPGGFVFHVNGQGEVKQVLEIAERYVWDIAWHKGFLYAGVGPGAKLYRVGPKGEVTIAYESSESHVLTVTSSKDDLLFGTEGQGLALRLSAKGEVDVLYDPEEEEVRGILPAGEGHVILGYTGSMTPSPRGPSKEREGEEGEEKTEGRPLQAPRNKGKGTLYWRLEDGEVRSLFQGTAPLILCAIPSQGKEQYWLGTGNEGRIVQVQLDGSWDVIAELEMSHVLGLIRLEQGSILACGSSPLCIVKADGVRDREGEYVSKVLDAGANAEWGNVMVESDIPKGCKVELSTRSGNTKNPDFTWTGWTRPQTVKPEGVQVGSPRGRFLQYTLTFSGTASGETPTVFEVRVPYKRSNLSPVVTRLSLAFSAPESSDKGTDREKRIPTAAGPWTKKVDVSWEVHDENQDPLLFDLHYRWEGEDTWWPLAMEQRNKTWTWDTEAWPDGRYALKLTACDSPGNLPKEAKRGELEIRPIVIDNTPPIFKSLKTSTMENAVTVKGILEDEMTPIVSVEYSLNASDWKRVFSEDGMWDSRREEFKLVVDGLEERQHILAIRVMDEAGNQRTEHIVFRLK